MVREAESDGMTRPAARAMRITRLRLSGFKSFVEPTELRIDPGLTGVVGPNGCGKSNLLEAIRWVMGESSPKSLRGGGMDDVIFAGTALRPSRDFAEVALVCDIAGATLPGMVPGDGDTLEVVRRIDRGAGSAYRANGHDVRQKDVALIFADAATGAHSPALVSQGKVAAIISAKPQDRRQLLEEAAGIAGLHVRRKDAEQKLRATEANLARVAAMLADMEVRAGALRRQARAAERYGRLSQQITTAEARMIYARWRDAAAAADAARNEAKAAQDAVDAAGHRQQEAAEAHSAAVAALAMARSHAATLKEREHALSSDLARLRGDRDALVRRLADLEQEAGRITRDHAAEDALAREGAEAISRLEAAVRQATRAIAAREKDRPAIEVQVASAAESLRDADVALAQTRARAANEGAERRIADAALAEAGRRVSRVESELARIEAEAAGAGDGPALAVAARVAAADAESATKAVTAAEGILGAAAQRRLAAQSARDTADSALAEARTALASLESEYAALERSLSASTDGDRQLIDALRVVPGYESAVAAALSDDATAPVLDHGAISSGRGWIGAAVGSGDPELAPGLTPLSTYVTAPPVLARRLAQVGVIDDDAGQPLAVGQRLVTRSGRMRRWDGFVAFGDSATGAERLVRGNRLHTIAQQLPQVRSALDQMEANGADAAAAFAQADAAVSEARLTLTRAEEDARRLQRRADDCDAALARHSTMTAHIAERRSAATADMDEAILAQRAAQAVLANLPDGGATLELQSRQEDQATAARAALAELRDALSALDRDIARLREGQIEAQAELRGWTARAGEAARRIATMNDRRAEIGALRDQLANEPARLDAAITDGETATLAMAADVAQAIEAESSASAEAGALATQLDALREALATVREARAGAVARAENAESRRIEMGRVSGERFSCPPPLLPETAGFDVNTVISPQDESAQHERLLQERDRIGPVNLIAGQELAELEGEHAATASESEELQQAVHRLRGSIGHLNREGRQRLNQAFEDVDRHFQRLFNTLFGGGQAHLAMVDSDDPLEAGLEIMAQPPGKKLSMLTLLSGGEQALTAIALIFALFLTNPAPICVLDEVDAPLDDANVERFCDLLDAMVQQTATRYLIVTHNAVTMARMHRLFGVTMVEQGISRLVSVDLGRATELLAAE